MAGLEAKGVSRAFASVQALDSVDLSVAAGEIHAVLGENGAGKSTLMAILAGFLMPDSGSVTWQGHPLPLGHPGEIRKRGVAMVHQHFMLVPQFTVRENLALDRLDHLRGKLDSERLTESARLAAASVGWEIPFDARTGSLPVGVQQRVEILKALGTGAELIILDEPTAVLSPSEVDDLIRVLKELKSQGRTIILIAHKLDEVYAAADRVTVLRRGRVVGKSDLADITPAELAQQMVGDVPEPVKRGEKTLGEPVLTARGLVVRGDRGEEAVRGATLEVRAGEVLGIGGVDGNGQIELAEALAGIRPLAAGSLTQDERSAYIPQDRQRDGLALEMPIWENMLLEDLPHSKHFRKGFLNKRETQNWADALRDEYAIKAEDTRLPARSLSGGNQQKVIVSRVLDRRPRVIIAVNPTRGLDIRAANFVREQLLEAAANGAGVVLISTDHDELAALADRIWFLSRGKLVEGDAQAYLGAGA